MGTGKQNRTRKMVDLQHSKKVVERALLRGAALHDHPRGGPHGQTPILRLLQLKLRPCVRVGLPVERVEPEVSWFTVPVLLGGRDRDTRDH